uniref:Uncharacterized protein n=1 Tax=Glossina brevipalpis TaxID=37001 RepID=A0A1A9W735_9MUSC
MVLLSQSKILRLLIFTIIYYVLVTPSICRSLESSKSATNEHNWERNGVVNAANSLNSASSVYYSDKRSLLQSLLSSARESQKLGDKFTPSWDFVDILLTEHGHDERSKRFDDYGHMRFGKRGVEEHVDDYGHMRFGRKVPVNDSLIN